MAIQAISLSLDPERAAQQALAAYKRRLLDLGAALQQDTMDRERTRALLADILGPVVLRRDSEGEWAEMEEPAQRLALALWVMRLQTYRVAQLV